MPFNFFKKFLYFIIIFAVSVGLFWVITHKDKNSQTIQNNNQAINNINSSVTGSNANIEKQKTILTSPINNALNRITKKPFGIYITPQNSPVQPEKFKGFHTGTDFETLADEQNIDMPIYAVCVGPLLVKEWVKGYGGVAVQECQLDNQAVTALYGHLKLSSITAKVGDQFKVGDRVGILGKGYGLETDGERKHLHLGIHKGSAVNFLGYVQKQTDLSQWLDIQNYL